MKNIEEAVNYITTKLINFNLKNNGEVTLEEAKFLNKLTFEVITEAAEELANEIESEDEVQETPLSEKVLTDEQGNEYIYNPVTGALDPVDTPASEDDENEDNEDEVDGGEFQSEVENQEDESSGVIPELGDNGIATGEGLMESVELEPEDIAKKLLSL